MCHTSNSHSTWYSYEITHRQNVCKSLVTFCVYFFILLFRGVNLCVVLFEWLMSPTERSLFYPPRALRVKRGHVS